MNSIEKYMELRVTDQCYEYTEVNSRSNSGNGCCQVFQNFYFHIFHKHKDKNIITIIFTC